MFIGNRSNWRIVHTTESGCPSPEQGYSLELQTDCYSWQLPPLPGSGLQSALRTALNPPGKHIGNREISWVNPNYGSRPNRTRILQGYSSRTASEFSNWQQ